MEFEEPGQSRHASLQAVAQKFSNGLQLLIADISTRFNNKKHVHPVVEAAILLSTKAIPSDQDVRKHARIFAEYIGEKAADMGCQNTAECAESIIDGYRTVWQPLVEAEIQVNSDVKQT